MVFARLRVNGIIITLLAQCQITYIYLESISTLKFQKITTQFFPKKLLRFQMLHMSQTYSVFVNINRQLLGRSHDYTYFSASGLDNILFRHFLDLSAEEAFNLLGRTGGLLILFTGSFSQRIAVRNKIRNKDILVYHILL